MKKIILLSVVVVLIVALSLVGFMGCAGNTSLTQIFSEYNIWRSAKLPEVFTYSMYKGTDTTSIGTLTMRVETLSKNATYYLGKTGLVESSEQLYEINTESVNETYMATTTLETLDGTYSKTTIAIFTKSYQILGSYSNLKTLDKEESFVSKNTNGKKYKYRLSSNWDEEKSIKNGKYETSPYFDNTMIYYVARSMPDDSAFASYTFNIFDLDKNSKEKVSLTNSLDKGTAVNVNGQSDAINSKTITMKTSDSLLGTTNNISCNVAYAKINGYKNVITRIIEGEYYYVLNV